MALALTRRAAQIEDLRLAAQPFARALKASPTVMDVATMGRVSRLHGNYVVFAISVDAQRAVRWRNLLHHRPDDTWNCEEVRQDRIANAMMVLGLEPNVLDAELHDVILFGPQSPSSQR